jgi:hypothetical protein
MEFGAAKGRSISPPFSDISDGDVGLKRSFSPSVVGSRSEPKRVCRGVDFCGIQPSVYGLQFPTFSKPSRSNTPMGQESFTSSHMPFQGVAPACANVSGPTVFCRPTTPQVEQDMSRQSRSPSISDCGMTSATLQNHPRGPAPKPCYLCYFSDEPVCVQYSKFIMQESARMSRQQIAKLVSKEISCHEMRAGRSPRGATAVDIERHIALHMLYPTIKIPELIRELDGVRHLLRGSITNVCPETGTSIIDTGNVSLYLRVVREIQQVYKMGDPTKLSLGGTGLPTATITSDI